MRNLTSFVLLGSSVVLVAACTTNGDTADSNSSAMSDTTSESAEIAGSFASESSSAITADELAAPSNTSVTGPLHESKLVGVRAELVTALEAIAADPHACVSGSASLTQAASQTADCSAIGTNGSYPGGLTLTFNDCALLNGGILNGTASVTVTRALSAGATCGPTASVDVGHTVTMTNLSYTTPSKYVLTYPTYNAVVTSTHAIDALPTLVTLVSLAGQRTVADPAGTLILNHEFSGSGTVALAVGSRTINGSFTVDHELLRFTAAIAVTNVERIETCCKPISGSVDITLSSQETGEAVSGDFTYGPACGDVSLDGKLIGVAECL